jgi:uncharacterized protein (TIGR00369 family)
VVSRRGPSEVDDARSRVARACARWINSNQFDSKKRSETATLRLDNEIAGGSPMPAPIAKSYGTVTADRRREMSGLEFVQGLVDGTLPLNMIAQTLGYDVIEVEKGRVVVTVEPSDAHLNPYGTVHGGLTATLLDSCMGLAVQSTLDKGFGQTTVEFKVSLLRPILPATGRIKAEGIVLNCGRRVGTAEGRLTDSKGRLLAHGTTTCLIFEAN